MDNARWVQRYQSVVVKEKGIGGCRESEWWCKFNKIKLIKLEGWELCSINEGNCMGDHNPSDFVQAKQKSGRQMGQVERGSPNRSWSPAALIIHRDVPLPFSQTPRLLQMFPLARVVPLMSGSRIQWEVWTWTETEGGETDSSEDEHRKKVRWGCSSWAQGLMRRFPFSIVGVVSLWTCAINDNYQMKGSTLFLCKRIVCRVLGKDKWEWTVLDGLINLYSFSLSFSSYHRGSRLAAPLVRIPGQVLKYSPPVFTTRGQFNLDHQRHSGEWQLKILLHRKHLALPLSSSVQCLRPTEDIKKQLENLGGINKSANGHTRWWWRTKELK